MNNTNSMFARATPLLFGALFVIGLVAPFAVYPTFLMKILCFGLFACAFNLLLGFVGLLSFGHAAFSARRAISAACWCATPASPRARHHWRNAGGRSTGLGVRGAGHPSDRDLLRDDHARAVADGVFRRFAVEGDRRRGRSSGVPRGHLFGLIDMSNNIAMYYLVFAVFCIGFFIIYRTIHSPFGQILKAIRENEPRAISLGYDVAKFKLLAFVLSASLAGMAGATKTLVFQLASLTDVHWHMSGEVVLMTLLGGLGTILGPLVGAATIVSLQTELADSVGSWVTVIMGVIFVICVLLFRRGIVGELQALIQRAGIR